MTDVTDKLRALQEQAGLLSWAAQTIATLQSELDLLRREQKSDQEFVASVMADSLLCPERSRFFCDDEDAPMTHGCRLLRDHATTDGHITDAHYMSGIKYLIFDELKLLRQFYRDHMRDAR